MRLSVKLKLAAAFGIVVVLTATVGAIAYTKLSSMNGTVDRILSERVSGLETALTAQNRRAAIDQGFKKRDPRYG